MTNRSLPCAFAALIAACLLTVAASPTAAQTEPAGQTDEAIVVNGQANLEQQIRSFVGALTPATARGQISRFETSICPVAVGLSETQRAAVEDRIRRVAEAAGLRIADANCPPNLLLIVTPDKAETMKALAKKYSYLFGDRSPTEIRRIAREPGSAAAWQVQDLLNADGMPLERDRGLPINRTTRPESRLTASGRQYFLAAAVVVESRALEGLSATQLADYAAMRALARIDPTKLDATSAPTILRVIDAPRGTALPVTLTEWDFGFLKGLYSSPHNLYAPSQRSEIGRVVEKEIGAKSDKREAPPPAAPEG